MLGDLLTLLAIGPEANFLRVLLVKQRMGAFLAQLAGMSKMTYSKCIESKI